MKVSGKDWHNVAVCASAAMMIAAAAAVMLSQEAAANAKFAKDTGKSCVACHTNAKGGGPLTPLGDQFKANGNKMPL